MAGRKVVVYYAWRRPGEVEAPLEVIEDRFPTLFESRRMQFPRFEEYSDPTRFDQGIGGFLDHIMKQNFAAFVKQAGSQTGHAVVEIERVADDGARTPLDTALLDAADTLIVISFDSLRTGQDAGAAEVEALRRFLAHPDHLVFAATTVFVSLRAILTSIVKRVLRPTSVAMCVSFAPVRRSPSQCPDTARSSISAGRSRMETISRICPCPLFALSAIWSLLRNSRH